MFQHILIGRRTAIFGWISSTSAGTLTICVLPGDGVAAGARCPIRQGVVLVRCTKCCAFLLCHSRSLRRIRPRLIVGVCSVLTNGYRAITARNLLCIYDRQQRKDGQDGRLLQPNHLAGMSASSSTGRIVKRVRQGSRLRATSVS